MEILPSPLISKKPRAGSLTKLPLAVPRVLEIRASQLFIHMLIIIYAEVMKILEKLSYGILIFLFRRLMRKRHRNTWNIFSDYINTTAIIRDS
jgi:hypothetical protein